MVTAPVPAGRLISPNANVLSTALPTHTRVGVPWCLCVSWERRTIPLQVTDGPAPLLQIRALVLYKHTGQGELGREALEWPCTVGGGGNPPLDPPLLQAKVKMCEKRNLLLGKSYRAIFGAQPVGSQPQPLLSSDTLARWHTSLLHVWW